MSETERPYVVGDVVILTKPCELGDYDEMAVVTAVDNNYITLVFPNRESGGRIVMTGVDYKFMVKHPSGEDPVPCRACEGDGFICADDGQPTRHCPYCNGRAPEDAGLRGPILG